MVNVVDVVVVVVAPLVIDHGFVLCDVICDLDVDIVVDFLCLLLLLDVGVEFSRNSLMIML